MVTKRRMYPIYVYVVVLMLCITALITTVNAASITVTSPTTGMNWELGSGHTITWSFSDLGTDEFVRIFLYKGGTYVGEIFGNNAYIPIGTGGTGSKYWGIPLSEPTLPAGDNYQIYIEYVCNPYPCVPPNNMSGYFSLSTPPPTITITAPNGGEIWQRGTTQTVTWSYTGDPGNTLLIWLRKGSLVYALIGNQIDFGTNGQGSYTWPIDPTGATGSDWTIEIFVVLKPDIIDSSNGYFTLTAPVVPPPQRKIGVYQNGAWYLDNDGSGTWNSGDKAYSFGAPGWTPIVGDWNATGNSSIGVSNGQHWYLDWNGNGVFDTGVDKAYSFGSPGWKNVTGDWNGDGKSEIGVTNGQQWYLDWNGNGVFDSGLDKAYSFGSPGWTPIVGDWNATGNSYIGVTNGQQWYLDWNGNGAFDIGVDKAYLFGAPGWTPIVGDWTGTGFTRIGVTNGQQWYLDWNGNGGWDADAAYSFGAPGWIPVVGDWSGNGMTKIGVTNGQQWYLDENGNGVWDYVVDYAYHSEHPGGRRLLGNGVKNIHTHFF